MVKEEFKELVVVTEPLPLRPPLKLIVVDDDGTSAPASVLPDTLPVWAMPLADHQSSISRTATYRCTDPACHGEHDEYRTSPRDLPFAKVCGAIRESESDGSLSKCTAAAVRRTVFPGEGVALNARRFEQLSIYERVDFDSSTPDFKRGHDRYYIPGRNNEPTEPGMKRIDITNIQQYNRVIKEINAHETQKMREHRQMHAEYFKARRKAMREDVDARVGPQRSHPLIQYLRRAMRSRSDGKQQRRYSDVYKPLDAHFHAQLIEYDQGKIQDYCDADTGWKSRRAK